MSTAVQGLVTKIKNEYAPKWSRARIRSHINWAQNVLFNTDCAQSIFLNKADDSFPYPLLKTTAGTLKYEIDDDAMADSDGDDIAITLAGRSTTCRRVKRIFLSTTSIGSELFNRRFYGEEVSLIGLNSYYSRSLYNVTFYEVPGMIYNKSDAEDANVVFSEDPDTTTEKYYVEFYMNPVPLASEEIPLSIDGDEWEMALIDGAVGRIEDSKNGKSEKLDKFMNYWIGRYKSKSDWVQRKKAPYQIKQRAC